MNNLIPLVASDRPLALAFRLLLFLLLIVCLVMTGLQAVQFIRLFEIDLVARPELPAIS